MGVGFLTMALLRYYGIKPAEEYLAIKSVYGSLILGTIGALLVAMGVLLLVGLEAYTRYVDAVGAIVLGFVFLAAALRVIKPDDS